MKKVALYCRVSTEAQGDKKTTERQLFELKEYCKRNNYEIVKEYKDVISGTIMKRLELDQLKEDAKNGLFELVLISEVSRISRGDDAIVDVVLFEREMEKSGVKVYFLDGSSDNEIVKAVKSIVAKTERIDFMKRTMNGRMARASRGSVLGTKTPYGYKYFKKEINGFRGGEWKIDQNENRIVKLVFELYLQLRSERKVIKGLEARGIKPREGGKYWRRSSIRKILKNQTYHTGITHYKEIAIKVPKILRQDIFIQIQLTIKENTIKRFKDTPYLLNGLLRCGSCDSSYSGEICKGVRFYRCNNRHKVFPEPRTCNAKMVQAEAIESVVWNQIRFLMQNPEELKQKIEYLSRDEREVEELLGGEKKDLEKKVAKIEKAKDRFLDIYGEGGISKAKLMAKITETDKEGNVIKEELRSIEKKLTEIKNKPTLIKNLEEFCKRDLDNVSYEEKREFLRLVVKRIRYNSELNEIKLEGNIPISAEIGQIRGILMGQRTQVQ